MLGKYVVLGLLTISAVITGDQNAALAATLPSSIVSKAVHKSLPVKHVKRHRARPHHMGLVPPPPAYMPSILPELAVKHNGLTQVADARIVEKKPENPYKKYINTPFGETPMPVQSRKGVSTWNPRS